MDSWGVCFGPAWGTSISELLEPARSAEEAGFDRIATGEYRNDALTWLGAFAGATRAIPVATTIASVALRHASVVGESIAALRDVHGDRIELGLGLSHPSITSGELRLPHPSLEDLEDYVEAVRSVLRGTRKRTGRFVVPPHNRTRLIGSDPTIRVAVLGEVAARHAARYADGAILTWASVDWTARIVASIRKTTVRDDFPVWSVIPTLPHRDRQQARVACVRHLRPYLELPAYRRMLAATTDPERIDRAARSEEDDDIVLDILGTDLVDSIAANGAREDVLLSIARHASAGADAIILYPLETGAGWREALAKTISELAP